MSVQGPQQKHCTGCETCPNLKRRIAKQCLSSHFDILVNFGQVFGQFLDAFTVDMKYSLFIVNVIKCYLMAYLCGAPNGRYIYGSSCKQGIIYL